MLNDNSGHIRKSYTNVRQILFNTEHVVRVGVVVNDDNAEVNEDGRKILKAGTPLAGDLMARTMAFKPVSGSEKAVGVLEHDVDITKAQNNGTLIIFGFINVDRLDEDVKTKITDDVKAGMPLVTFLND